MNCRAIMTGKRIRCRACSQAVVLRLTTLMDMLAPSRTHYREHSSISKSAKIARGYTRLALTRSLPTWRPWEPLTRGMKLV